MSGWAVGDGYRVYPTRMNITSEVADLGARIAALSERGAPEGSFRFGEKLTRYKVPETVNFIDAIPKNPVGKLLRRVLAAG